VLCGIANALDTLQQQLSRLHEELLCLDDGVAADLLGGLGPKNAAKSAGEAAKACALASSDAQDCKAMLGQVSSVWVELPDPMVIAVAFVSCANSIGHFRGLVDLHTAQRQAAVTRAKVAIESRAFVEFTARKSELDSSSDTSCPWERSPSHGWSLCGLWSRTLRDIERGTQPQDQAIMWVGTRASVEDLLQQLRRHYFHVPSAVCHPLWAPAVLDCVFHTFDELTAHLARLYEDVNCLDRDDDMELGSGAPEHSIAALLVAASIQRQALEFKCKLLATAKRGRVAGVIAKKVSIGPIVSFLGEVVAVGDAMDAHIAALEKHRKLSVEDLKASTEASAWASLPLRADAGPFGGA